MAELLAAPLVVLAVLAALLLLVAAAAVLRRLAVSRGVGSFDCSVRPSGGSWSLGVARYGTNRLDWFPIFSLSPRQRSTWGRGELRVHGQRRPEPTETAAVLPQSVVVRCSVGGQALDLAMAPEAYTGLTSWLEAGPPSSPGRVT